MINKIIEKYLVELRNLIKEIHKDRDIK